MPPMKTSWTNVFQISYFTSAPVQFTLEGKHFYAHPGLISRLSQPLARFIEDNLSTEKKLGYADCLKDVSAATFDRFLEWAYRGYYTPPSPTIDSKIESEVEGNIENAARPTTSEDAEPEMAAVEEVLVPLQEPAALDFGWDNDKTKKKSKKGCSKMSPLGFEATAFHPPEPAPSQREDLKKAFCSLKLPVPPKAKDWKSTRKNLSACENYTNVFLCHAELYVFAVRNEVDELRDLALKKLHAVLSIFELYQERTGDIIALLGYAYAKTEAPDSGKEPLRDLLTRYVAFWMDTLMLDEGFKDLMKVEGDLLSDYMSSVLKRIKS